MDPLSWLTGWIVLCENPNRYAEDAGLNLYCSLKQRLDEMWSQEWRIFEPIIIEVQNHHCPFHHRRSDISYDSFPWTPKLTCKFLDSYSGAVECVLRGLQQGRYVDIFNTAQTFSRYFIALKHNLPSDTIFESILIWAQLRVKLDTDGMTHDQIQEHKLSILKTSNEWIKTEWLDIRDTIHKKGLVADTSIPAGDNIPELQILQKFYEIVYRAHQREVEHDMEYPISTRVGLLIRAHTEICLLQAEYEAERDR